MLTVGLTGGIGAGKSTAAWRLAERGAMIIDADRLAREAVEPGTDGLAEVVAAFGSGVLTAEGTLDRPALGRLVFGDEAARRRLNAILHPRIGALTSQRMAAAAPGAIVVHDVPLLVENGLGAAYHLVAVVHAAPEERVRRLVKDRGMPEADARARIAAQADDDARREAADVWLDNQGQPAALIAAVDALWDRRLRPFAAALAARQPQVPQGPVLLTGGPAASPQHAEEWARQAARLTARVMAALGDTAVRTDHIGATAVPGLSARDIVDLQAVVRDGTLHEAVGRLAGAAVFPAGTGPAESLLAGADPLRPMTVRVEAEGAGVWRERLALRDLLRSQEPVRREYAQVREASAVDEQRYAAAKAGWLDRALRTWPAR